MDISPASLVRHLVCRSEPSPSVRSTIHFVQQYFYSKEVTARDPHFNICIEDGPTFVNPALVFGINVSTFSDVKNIIF